MARPDKLPKFLSDEEVQRLLDQPNERYYSPQRDKLMMRVQLSAGLRPGEVVALKSENIDFNSGRIDALGGRVQKTASSSPGTDWSKTSKAGWSGGQTASGCFRRRRARRSIPPT
jgi:integrase